jgi:hypothetical protein
MAFAKRVPPLGDSPPPGLAQLVEHLTVVVLDIKLWLVRLRHLGFTFAIFLLLEWGLFKWNLRQ